MITLYDFIAMNFDERAEATWTGTLLGERREGHFIIQLYNLYSFYIEVYYDEVHLAIRQIRPFKSSTLLNPYLNQIHLKI